MMDLSNIWLLTTVLLIHLCCIEKSRAQCITNFLELETSILSNELNIQSLTEGFFPTNRYPALVVEVHYYVNRSLDNSSSYSIPIHPVLPQNPSEAIFATYIFRWLASPALLYGDPKVLEGFSLRSLVVDSNFAHLVIQPFCSDDTDQVRGLLSNVTIWLKSYAIRRSSTLQDGLNDIVQGYSSYKSNNSLDDFYVFQQEEEYRFFIFLTTASIFILVIFCTIAIPIEVDKYYVIMHEKSEEGRSFEQTFRFKSIFWAFVSVFGWILVIIAAVDIYHYLEFGVTWRSEYAFYYYMITFAVVVIGIIAIVASILIVKRAYTKKSLIELPCLISRAMCQNGQREAKNNDKCCSYTKIGLLVWQVLAVFVIFCGITGLSFHACGVVLAILANPIQVISNVAIYMIVALCTVFAFAYIFERTEEILADETHGKTPKIHLLCQILVFICLILFIVCFGYTYLNVILFIGDDNTGFIASFTKVLPLLVLTGITWVMKNEIKKYITNDTEKDSILPVTHQNYTFATTDAITLRNNEVGSKGNIIVTSRPPTIAVDCEIN